MTFKLQVERVVNALRGWRGKRRRLTPNPTTTVIVVDCSWNSGYELFFLMKIHEVPAWLSIALVCAVSPNIVAQSAILDQRNNAPALDGSGSLLNGQTVAQTWQIGVSGTLDRIDFAVYRRLAALARPDAPIIAEIRDTTLGGLPGSIVLASSLVPIDLIPSASIGYFTGIDFSGSRLLVQAGERLSIILRTQSSVPYGLLASADYGADGYSAGIGYINYERTGTGWQEPFEGVPRWDWGFRTYVVVPEPTAVSLYALCILGLVFCFRGRKGQSCRRLHSSL